MQQNSLAMIKWNRSVLSNFSQNNWWLYLIVHDSTLQTILSIPGFTDGMFTHLLAGLGAGFFAVLIGSPVDVVMFLVLYQIYIFTSRTYHNSKIPTFILKLLQIDYYLLENWFDLKQSYFLEVEISYPLLINGSIWVLSHSGQIKKFSQKGNWSYVMIAS